MEQLFLVAAGLFSGVISGMGIGGGIVLIPILTLVLGFDQKAAQGMNLLYFIPTALPALWVHWKNKNIKKEPAVAMMISGPIGAGIGAFFAMHCPIELLRKLFACFLLLVALYQFKMAWNDWSQAKKQKQGA